LTEPKTAEPPKASRIKSKGFIAVCLYIAEDIAGNGEQLIFLA
jgi:hypothetical protein